MQNNTFITHEPSYSPSRRRPLARASHAGPHCITFTCGCCSFGTCRQPEQRAAMSSKRFGSRPQDRRSSHAVNVEPGRTEPLPCNSFDSPNTPPSPLRVDFVLVQNMDRTRTNNGMDTDNVVQRPPRDTQDQELLLADRAGVTRSSFRKGLGVPCHPPPSVALDAAYSYTDNVPYSLATQCWQY
jgi:hypothetical protein